VGTTPQVGNERGGALFSKKRRGLYRGRRRGEGEILQGDGRRGKKVGGEGKRQRRKSKGKTHSHQHNCGKTGKKKGRLIGGEGDNPEGSPPQMMEESQS